MSRYYDVLREARGNLSTDPVEDQWTRSRRDDPNEVPVNGSAKAESTSTVPAPSETFHAAEVESDGGWGQAAGATALLPELQTDLQNGTSQKVIFQPQGEIHIDESVPILPHATDASVVEHYRKLRTKLLQQHAIKPFRSLLIASPSPQEGKTLTTMNLALSFGMLPSFRVLVVDGDLRRGSIAKCLGQGDRPGFSDLIAGTSTLDEVIVKASNIPVHFMMHGSSTIPRGELLNSSRLKGHFQNLAEHFDLVLIDSPPVNLLTDAQLLAENCDAILLIARAFATTRKALQQTAAELKGFRIVGTVLNGGTRTQTYRRYNGYYDGK